MARLRMIELWADEGEAEFGIKVAGELGFRATTRGHARIVFKRIVDSTVLLEGSDYDWAYTLDRWVLGRRGTVAARSGGMLVS
jgi:hypothetical protein